MMTTSIQMADISWAIELSNKGADLIESERYDEASAILLDAVRQFREGNKELQLLNVQDTPPPTPSQRKTLRKMNDNSTDSLSSSSSSSVNNKNRWRNSAKDYVYMTPIFLPEVPIISATTEDCPSFPIGPSLVQLSIVFNFAIARHLRALNMTQQPTKRDYKLRTTLKLYNWALKMEREIKDEDSSSFFGVLPCLGLINNCAQIHRTLNKEKKAEKMFQILLSSLMLLKERGEELDDSHKLDGFYSATSYLILKTAGVARAA